MKRNSPWQPAQLAIIVSFPEQCIPPLLGGGLVQVLFFERLHSELQEDHGDQAAHLPSTAGEEQEIH